MSSSQAQSLGRHKFSVLSLQSSVTTGGGATADSGQLVPNPQPRTPRPDSPALSAQPLRIPHLKCSRPRPNKVEASDGRTLPGPGCRERATAHGYSFEKASLLCQPAAHEDVGVKRRPSLWVHLRAPARQRLKSSMISSSVIPSVINIS